MGGGTIVLAVMRNSPILFVVIIVACSRYEYWIRMRRWGVPSARGNYEFVGEGNRRDFNFANSTRAESAMICAFRERHSAV